jgi:hypothetical protein
MRAINILKGPFELVSIDVYPPNDQKAGYALPLVPAEAYDGEIIRIDDALGEQVVDAYFCGPAAEREQAVQWLLDFANCSL